MKISSRSILNIFTLCALLASLLGSAVFVTPAYAAGFTVTKTADTADGTCDADCSLREAIIAANALAGADIVSVPAGTYTLTIAGIDEDLAATGDLDLTSDITITGTGAQASDVIIQAGTIGYPGVANGIDRVFHMVNAVSVTITNVTIANGKTAINKPGGGIENVAGGNLTVMNSVFSGNTASSGGGIYHHSGSLLVMNTTFSGNTVFSGGRGGGINNASNSSAQIINSTFSGNQATNGGGGIANASDSSITVTNSTFSGNVTTNDNEGSGIRNENLTVGSATLKNTIVADGGVGGDCYGVITADVHNLDTDGTCGDAVLKTSLEIALGALADNGGATPTMALQIGSAAIDAGDNAVCADVNTVNNKDQRGFTRPAAGCDIGAFEFPDYSPPTVLSITRADTNPTSAATVNFTVTFSDPVIGVDAADFKIANAAVLGASIASVAPVSTTVYTVTINTSQNGILRLDVPSTATIVDVAENQIVAYASGESYTVSKGNAPTMPVLVSPLANALVTTTPTLNWGDSYEVMALTPMSWHYEINVTNEVYGFNQNYNTVDGALVGLGNSEYTFLTPLMANRTFTWKVRAYNDQNQYSAWSLPRTFRTKLGTPSPSLPLDSTTLLNKRPTFTWGAVTGATSYTVQILKLGVVVNTGTVTAPITTYTPAADLLPNTTYTWRVKANGLNQGDYSTPLFTFTTSLNAPTVPVLTSPLANAFVDSAVLQTLDWNPVLATPANPAAAGYEYYLREGNSPIGVTSVAAPASESVGFPLLAHTNYSWQVRSFNSTGQYSAWSALRMFKTRVATPVLNLPADSTTENNKRPTFEWDSVDGATSYTVQILKLGVVVNTGTVLAPNYIYTPTVDLLPSQIYTWKVKANNVTYPGLYSAPFTFTTSVNPPKIPVLAFPATGVLISSTYAYDAPLGWEGAVLEAATLAYPSAASYDVQVSTNAGFANISPNNNTKTLNVADETTRLSVVLATGSAPDAVIRPGRTYYWRVRSISGEGNHSAWSATRTIKVKFVAPKLVLPADNDTGISRTAPTFTWNSNGLTVDNGLWTNTTIQLATTPPTATTFTVVKSFTLIMAPKQTYTADLTATTQLLGDKTYYWRVQINGLYTPIFSTQNFLTAYRFTTVP